MGNGWVLGFLSIAWLTLAGCNASLNDSGQGGDASAPGHTPMTSDSITDAGTSFVLDEAGLSRDPASGVSEDALGAAVAGNNAFAVDLYAHVREDVAAGAANLLTSPLTASLALTMTYAGATGQTATEMATALHIQTDAGVTIFDGQNALSQALLSRGPAALAIAVQAARDFTQPAPAAGDYQLEVVNAVWGEKTYPWAMPFLNILAQEYGTGVYLVDFETQPDPARQAINSWVSSQTSDKINNLLPPQLLGTSTRMVLVDALHLKLPWSTAFDSLVTAAAPFTRSDGTTVSAPFMNRTDTLDYMDDGQAQVVGLPLYGGQLSVVIALPHEGTSLAEYEATLTAGSAALSQPPSSTLVALSIPKATFTSPSFSLKAALERMGMIQAFGAETADFSGLCPDPPDGLKLFVSDVLQKATFSMQETGVEAAAATAVIIDADSSVSATDAAPPQPIPMVVNRPYLIAIIDTPTGAILSLGHLGDPTDVGSP
jgi:serine protease inhibitor